MPATSVRLFKPLQKSTDKTGTLTSGVPSVTDCSLTICPDFTDEETLERTKMIFTAIYGVEEQFSHPLAKALCLYACTRLGDLGSPPKVTVSSTEEIMGRGLKGILQFAGPNVAERSYNVAVGNESLMQDIDAPIPVDSFSPLQKWKLEAKSVVIVAMRSNDRDHWEVHAIFAICRSRGRSRHVSQYPLLSFILTSSHSVGIAKSCVKAGVLPEDKADHIRLLKSLSSFSAGSGENGSRFALFLRDGLNDSVGLVAADVGLVKTTVIDCRMFR